MADVFFDANLMIAVLAGALVISFIMIISLMVQVGKINKRYRKIEGISSLERVEQVIGELQKNIQALETKSQGHTAKIQEIFTKLGKMKSHVGIHRYNAFAQQGNDLSFSVSLLDEEQNGFVLTGIHNREESYIYAKPVEKGQSKYSLSPEEKLVISQTVSKQGS